MKYLNNPEDFFCIFRRVTSEIVHYVVSNGYFLINVFVLKCTGRT